MFTGRFVAHTRKQWFAESTRRRSRTIFRDSSRRDQDGGQCGKLHASDSKCAFLVIFLIWFTNSIHKTTKKKKVNKLCLDEVIREVEVKLRQVTRALGILPRSITKANEYHKGKWVSKNPMSTTKANEYHKGQWVSKKQMSTTKANEHHKSQWIPQKPMSNTKANEYHKSQWTPQNPMSTTKARSSCSSSQESLRGCRG